MRMLSGFAIAWLSSLACVAQRIWAGNLARTQLCSVHDTAASALLGSAACQRFVASPLPTCSPQPPSTCHRCRQLARRHCRSSHLRHRLHPAQASGYAITSLGSGSPSASPSPPCSARARLGSAIAVAVAQCLPPLLAAPSLGQGSPSATPSPPRRFYHRHRSALACL